MRYCIHAATTIGDLKYAFHQRYPQLRLEFEVPRTTARPSLPQRRLADGLPVISVSDGALPCRIDLPSTMTVEELECLFWRVLQLSVQVYRCAGAFWLHVTQSRDRSLAEQEEKCAARTEAPEPMLRRIA